MQSMHKAVPGACLLLFGLVGCSSHGPLQASDEQAAEASSPDAAVEQLPETQPTANDTELTADEIATPTDTESEAPVGMDDWETIAPYDPCPNLTEDTGILLDHLRRGLHAGACSTAAWFDSFFGDSGFEPEPNKTFGRIGTTAFWDERDHFDPALKLRVRYALPGLKDRFSVTVARDDEDELLEDRGIESFDPIPTEFGIADDEDWLLGLGYAAKNGLRSGFSTYAGVRISSKLDPYVQAHYRWNRNLGTKTILRFQETPFWSDRRGVGTTTRISLDRIVAPRVMLRWANLGTLAEDAEGLKWSSALIAYQNLTRQRAMSYSVQAGGSTDAEVTMANYGFEVRYRQRFLRDWLFAEFYSSLSWPREFREEERDSNVGVGVTLEMYFGNLKEVHLR
ncbi:MAG: hypothetical protein GY764_08275 [Halieaceae bacterium]|nr:hypothetical protein [Halieaceae bacterium]